MQLEIEELRKLTSEGGSPKLPNDIGPCQIIVMDKGFVYAGNVSLGDGFVTIKNAKNIRYWGTTKGLGELVNGPTDKTQIDIVGTIIAPFHSLIQIIPCKKNW